jgi:hypothetical protein
MAVPTRWFIVVLLAGQAAAAGARESNVSIATLRRGDLVAHDVRLRILGDDAAPSALSISIAAVDVPAIGLAGATLAADCELARAPDAWRCAGEARWTVAGGIAQAAPFAASWTDREIGVELRPAKSRLALTHVGDDTARWRFTAEAVPVAWFDAAIKARWPGLSSLSGTLGGDATFDADATTVHGNYRLAQGGFDSTDGTLAASGIAAGGKVDATFGDGIALRHDGAVRAGEVLVGNFYTSVASAVAVDIDAHRDRKGTWRVPQLVLDDPGVLRLQASAAPAADASWTIDVGQLHAVLPRAFERYAKTWAATHALGDLETRGTLDMRLALDGGLAGFSVRAADVDLVDRRDRFALHGLAGSIAWQRAGESDATTLDWESASLYRIPIGRLHSQWRSNAGRLALVQPTSLPLLSGTLDVSRLSWAPAAAGVDRLQAGAAVRGIDVAQLSRAFGWPEFGGRLGGAAPAIRYVDDRLEFGGGFMLAVFDGTVDVTGLAIERPFGTAPSLAADVAFDRLDLALLTGVFDIGTITGRLTGGVRALRMIDWQPVAFDADLHSVEAGKISQRAVNSLSSIGGGGIAAGLQTSMLRMFDTVGYARLGLKCRLANNVCRMDGIDSVGPGYVIVEGRGLPRIRVVGHQREVDWPLLVDRLRDAARGTAPVIR